MTGAVLRGLAIAIAVAAVIDPAVTTPRRVLPEVAVVPADEVADSALAHRVARALDDEVRVLRSPFAGAAATVVAGEAPPRHAVGLASPVFAVAGARDAADVAFETVTVPASAQLDAAVAVDADIRSGRDGGELDVVLEAGGVVVDRVTLDPPAADTLRRVRLTYVPAAAGAVPLRLSVRGEGDDVRAAADAVVHVVARRLAVLFHDTRPSWQSTFVRRALARDPRFDVAFRVVTSPGASVGAPGAPLSPGDADALVRYDAVVVGAPEGLRDGEVDALERFMRMRGGSVVLLLDSDAAGAHDRLAGVAGWAVSPGSDAAPIAASGGEDTLRAARLRFPRALPAGASAVARDPAGNAVLWESPVGAGRLVVSGALDAWRLRDPAASDFDAFWRALIAEAAGASPPALEASLARPVLRPGEMTEVAITVRAAALAEPPPGTTLHAHVGAALEGADVLERLRVLPEGSPGLLRARVRAPHSPGLYHVRVVSGGDEAVAPLLVSDAPAIARPDRIDLLRAWTSSRGGVTLAAADLGTLPAALLRTLPAVQRRETWHPMRSPWWIVPFALLLGAEWWWRRRRGLA